MVGWRPGYGRYVKYLRISVGTKTASYFARLTKEPFTLLDGQ